MESYHLPVAHRETVGANFTVAENEFGEVGEDEDFAFQYFTKTEGAPVGGRILPMTGLKASGATHP